MPNPNAHDQPAEGGTEQVEHTLQKQSEPKQNKKPIRQSDTTDRPNRTTSQERGDGR
jgi:hypothetical protein